MPTLPNKVPRRIAEGPPPARLRISDLRGIARLATQGTQGVARIAEGVHQSVWGTLGVPSAGRPGRTRGLTGMVYQSVHGITGLVGKGLEAGLRWLEARSEASPRIPATSAGRESLIAALNGVMGDRLEEDGSPFAIPMMAIPRTARPEMGTTQEDASSKILLVIHGLCVTDLQSHGRRRELGRDHGADLAAALGASALYLRYNSGLPIPDNGRRLAALLEDLLAQWPVPVEELTIVAHSMGGLVARSAVHYARQESHFWPETLKSLVFLGTPHHGAPLEKAGRWVDSLLESTPYSAPFAKLGKLRSRGITDLRHGRVVDGDEILPLPAGVACYAIAATLEERRTPLGERITGDGLVPLQSALGHHDDPRRALAFEDEAQWTAYRTGHMELLTSAAVCNQMLRWLAPDAEGPQAPDAITPEPPNRETPKHPGPGPGS